MPKPSYQTAALLLPPLLVTVAIVGGAVALIAPLFAPTESVTLTAAAAPAATVPTRPARDYAALGTSPLFGTPAVLPKVEEPPALLAAPAPQAAPAAGDGELPESLDAARTKARVEGIIYDQPGGRHRVILAGAKPPADGELATWGVGDTVESGVVIRYVESRRVVVSERGELRELRFAEIDDGDPRTSARRFLEGVPGVAVRGRQR